MITQKDLKGLTVPQLRELSNLIRAEFNERQRQAAATFTTGMRVTALPGSKFANMHGTIKSTGPKYAHINMDGDGVYTYKIPYTMLAPLTKTDKKA